MCMMYSTAEVVLSFLYSDLNTFSFNSNCYLKFKKKKFLCNITLKTKSLYRKSHHKIIVHQVTREKVIAHFKKHKKQRKPYARSMN